MRSKSSLPKWEPAPTGAMVAYAYFLMEMGVRPPRWYERPLYAMKWLLRRVR